MKLYIRPAACSLASHIVCREGGLDVQAVVVDRETNKTANGDDFFSISPHGYVPALVLDDGEILLEGPAIIQHLAEVKGTGNLALADGRQRRLIQSRLNYVATELHKPMAQLFDPAFAPVHDILRSQVIDRLNWVSVQLRNGFFAGQSFTVVDPYLLVVLNWSQWLGIDLTSFRSIQEYMRRVGARPAVQQALEAERLVHHADGIFFAPRAAN